MTFEKPYIKWFRRQAECFIQLPGPSYQYSDEDKAAIIWEADDGSYKTYTYQQLFMEVNRFANVLKKNGIKRGDAVTIYLPMIPELAISMLACSRIGAIHSIVFGGFSATALRDRIQELSVEALHYL